MLKAFHRFQIFEMLLFTISTVKKLVIIMFLFTLTTSHNKRKGTGNAQQVGSWTHKDVADDMNNNYIPNNKQNLPYIQDINIEQNYLNGVPIQNNAKGSSRVDISVTNNVNNNVHVGDIKTGNANYTTRQKNKNANNINGSNNQNGLTFNHQEINP